MKTIDESQIELLQKRLQEKNLELIEIIGASEEKIKIKYPSDLEKQLKNNAKKQEAMDVKLAEISVLENEIGKIHVASNLSLVDKYNRATCAFNLLRSNSLSKREFKKLAVLLKKDGFTPPEYGDTRMLKFTLELDVLEGVISVTKKKIDQIEKRSTGWPR